VTITVIPACFWRESIFAETMDAR